MLVNLYSGKVIKQGKLIAVAYSLRIHIETSSLWAVFVNKNSIRGGEKHLILVILMIHIIVSYDQNISLIFLCERWIPRQVVASVLCLLYCPETRESLTETVHFSTKNAYTSLKKLSLHYNYLGIRVSCPENF